MLDFIETSTFGGSSNSGWSVGSSAIPRVFIFYMFSRGFSFGYYLGRVVPSVVEALCPVSLQVNIYMLGYLSEKSLKRCVCRPGLSSWSDLLIFVFGPIFKIRGFLLSLVNVKIALLLLEWGDPLADSASYFMAIETPPDAPDIMFPMSASCFLNFYRASCELFMDFDSLAMTAVFILS